MSDLSSSLRAYAEGLRTGDLNEFDSTMFALIEAADRLEQQDIECDLVRRLLADHQRVEPHHADQCQLCREATAAIDGHLILPVAEWVNEEQGFQYLASGRLPDGTKLYAQAAIDGTPAQGKRQPDVPTLTVDPSQTYLMRDA